MLTVLGPYATTGFEDYCVIRRDRSTARQFTDKSVRFATPQWRKDSRIFAASALEHGYRCSERDDHDSGDPQKLSRGEIGAHQ
jgi:hypothetical protein